MTRHADQLLSRSFEEELDHAERAWLETHLASCDRCRALRQDLDTAEQRLERQESAADLPALSRPAPASTWRRSALVLAGAAAIVVLGVAISTLRQQEPAATDTPPTGSPVAALPRLVFARHVVLDQIPGGGAGVTGAYDAFEVIGPAGQRQSHSISGVAVGQPVFDGRSRIAYWRRASIERPSGTISGPYEVVVMDIQTGRERVLLTPADLGSNGDLRWTADGKSLVVPTRITLGSVLDPVRGRLRLVDADSGASRVVNIAQGEGIEALYVDSQIILGVDGSSYVVLDASSGAVRAQAAQRVPNRGLVGQWSDLTISPDGTVLELHRRFERESGPLWIWSARDPGTDLAKVDEQGISDPLFWPGRSEVVFTRPGRALAALDYRSGRTRTLVAPPGASSVVAVDSDGKFALVRGDAGLQVVERVGDELRARQDVALFTDPLLVPLGVVSP